MPRPFTPKVITANRLLEGDAVWLTPSGDWSPDIRDAELRLIDANRHKSAVVGAYLAEVKRGPNGPEPVHFRETFRTRGPSNYAHGKQEAETNV